MIGFFSFCRSLLRRAPLTEQQEVARSNRLRLYAIILGGPVITGLLIWQLSTLSPKYWCQTSFNVALADGSGLVDALKACLALQVRILDIKDHAIIGLLMVMGIVYFVLVFSQWKMRAEVHGPGGVGGTIGGDPHATVKTTTETTVTPGSPESPGTPPGSSA